jgi:hypothetical protein
MGLFLLSDCGKNTRMFDDCFSSTGESFRLFMQNKLFLHLTLMVVVISELFGAVAPSQARPVSVMQLIPLVPHPKMLVASGEMTPFPAYLSVHGLDPLNPAHAGAIDTLEELFHVLPGVKADFGGTAPYCVQFEQSDQIAHPEGYTLTADASGIKVLYCTEAGQFYGAQTVYQLLAYAFHGTEFVSFGDTLVEKDAATERYVPTLSIADEPAYRVRSFMADLGRTPYSMPLLKRLIRIMGQLKLNTLHLHLWDDQLCGFRFAKLPMGHENPFSLTADDLREIVRYARIHHISVMPEMESWGHVASIVYHYPELCAGEGMFRGASFGIGEKSYELLEKMYDEVVPCLEDTAAVHVGMDESRWGLLPGEESKGHTPETMLGRIYDILMRVAAKHHKQITMHLWADHAGRPLPKELEDKVVIEPWRYLERDGPSIVQDLERYGGAGKTPMMMGAGARSTAYDGSYEATRIWCQEGLKYPNVLGVTLCLWESNDLAGRLITLYGGADYAWTPETPVRRDNDPFGEDLREHMGREMRSWQIIFPEANPGAIDLDRGLEGQNRSLRLASVCGKSRRTHGGFCGARK